MKFTQFSILAVMFVVAAVVMAGCTGTGSAPAATGTVAAPAGTGAAPAGTAAASSGQAALSGSTVTGSDLFGGVSYNWVEYKMSTGGSEGQGMTIYYKYNKQTGKCTMRFEGAGAEAMQGQTLDCSSTGTSATTSDPNQASTDVKYTKVGTEVITVPAGTFTADKYTVTSQGTTSTFWIAGGKPLLKMQGGDATNSVTMELNGMG